MIFVTTWFNEFIGTLSFYAVVSFLYIRAPGWGHSMHEEERSEMNILYLDITQ